jgi:hypothetical protein
MIGKSWVEVTDETGRRRLDDLWISCASKPPPH